MAYPYPLLGSRNGSEGLQVVLQYAADDAVTGGLFTPLVLFGFFAIAFLASMFAQMKLRNNADAIASFAAAGLVTTGLALLMNMIPGVANLYHISACIAITVFGTAILFFSNKRR